MAISALAKNSSFSSLDFVEGYYTYWKSLPECFHFVVAQAPV